MERIEGVPFSDICEDPQCQAPGLLQLVGCFVGGKLPMIKAWAAVVTVVAVVADSMLRRRI